MKIITLFWFIDMTRIIVTRIEWLLRIGVFLTFLGHGFFALYGKAQWIKYLTIFGFSDSTALKLMTYIGVIDILIALVVLLRPHKYIVFYAFIWAFSTALIRPISGESILDFVERGANWVTPLCLFLLLNSKRKIESKVF